MPQKSGSVRGCSALIDILTEVVDEKRVVKPAWRPLQELIGNLYRMEPERDWTFCMRGSEGKDLFMRPVPKSRCETCKYAVR